MNVSNVELFGTKYAIKDLIGREDLEKEVTQINQTIQNNESNIAKRGILGMNDLSGAKVAFLGDSNCYEYATSGLMQSSVPGLSVINKSVYGATFKDNFVSQVDSLTAQDNPDYVFVWFGNNDVRRGTDIGVPQLSVNEMSLFTRGTAMGELNAGLLFLKQKFPTAKLCGVIINKPSDLDEDYWRYCFAMFNNIYKKWNVPVINFNDNLNISNFVPEQFSQYYKDGLHYNQSALQVINYKIISEMVTGLECSTDIDFNVVFTEHVNSLDGLTVAQVEELIQWTGKYQQPFNSNPNRSSWSGCVTIMTRKSTTKIVCLGTWSGNINLEEFWFVGYWMTPTHGKLRFLRAKDGIYTGAAPALTYEVKDGDNIDILSLGRIGIGVSIPNLAAIPSAVVTGMPDNIGPNSFHAIALNTVTGYTTWWAWTFNNAVYIGKALATDASITWSKIHDGT